MRYALAGNLAIAGAKGAVALTTGSAAMLAETVHSCADAGNQASLLIGLHASALAPSASHELDVRSAPLARSLARCAAPGEWLGRQPAGRRGRCGADCSTMQGTFVTSCVREPTLLAHATWSKVHSLAPDRGCARLRPPPI